MKRSSNLEEQLFAAALALPATERSRYLALACDGDIALCARLNTLLDAFESGAGLFANPTQMARSGVVGERIGEYRIIQDIGEGGCGVVYLAEQTAPMRREVALKVIKLGMDTRAVIARFEAERQALALMDHPNIAKVFDAGATPAGRPFFAMELVRGIKITDYCNQTRLTVQDRVAVFMQVCQAIQHAHHKGIVHRDIKPSNVLVTLCDGIPVAKVIDFGIAKATQGRLTDRTLLTELEQIVGTPAYVSPEQTALGSGQADTRSDIYSLGVLLYELLTGCTPFDIAEASHGAATSLRQRIQAAEPLGPSKYLSCLSREQLDSASVRYRTSAAKWMTQVQGDLDWIVLRCLEQDPARRYQAAEQLWLDLQRYLRDEPVVARPHRIAYTFVKFARRHRMVFATGATIITILVIATSLTAWLAVRAAQARQVAQEITSFLQNDVLAQAAPTHEPDRDIKLRTVLDRAAAKIEGRLVGRPLVEASIRETLGWTYDSLGEYSNAQGQFERILRIYRRELGRSHRRTLNTMSTLVRLLARQGKYAAGEVLGAEALRLHRQVLGPADADTLLISSALADLYMNEGKFTEGESLLGPLLEQQQRVYGPDHPWTLEFMAVLGGIYVGQSRYEEAQPLITKVLESRKRVLGAAHPDTIMSMHNLGILYLHVGKFVQSEALLTQALTLERRILGAQHPKTLNAMTSLAMVFWQQGKFAEEERLESEIVDLSVRVQGAMHPDTLFALNSLAKTYLEQGKLLSKAESLQAQALEGIQKVLGPQHRTTIGFKLNLALILERQRRLRDAEVLLSEGARTSARVLGAADHYTLEYLDHLGAVLIAQERFVAAESVLRAAMQGLREYSAKNWWVVDAPNQYEWQRFSTQSRLGEALVGLKRFAEAETHLLNGYEGLQRRANSAQARYRPDLKDAVARILHLYRAWGRADKVQEWNRRATDQPAAA